MSAARPCHGYSGENFDQLRRDQKGQRQPARHAGREGDGKVGRPPPSPPPPQPPRKCKRTFLIRLMRRDLAAVRPPGCRAPRPTRPTLQFLLQIHRTKYFRDQSYPSFVPSSVSIVRGFGGGPTWKRKGSPPPPPTGTRFSAYLFFHYSAIRPAAAASITISAHGGLDGRKGPHNARVQWQQRLFCISGEEGRKEREGGVIDRSLGPLIK